MKCPGILLCLLCVTGLAAGPPKFLHALCAEFQAGVKTLPADTSAKDLEMLSRIELMFSDTYSGGFGDRARPSGRYADIVESLMDLEATTHSEKVDALCETMITDVRNAVTKASREFRANFMPTVREAFTTGLSATSPREIDSPLVTLTNLQQQWSDLEGSSSEVLNLTRQILTIYQNGLLGLDLSENGHTKDSSRELLKLATYPQMPSLFGEIMLRSEFMEKMRTAAAKVASGPVHPESPPAKSYDEKTLELINGIKTLDDMAAAVIRIEALTARERALRNFPSESVPVRLLREYADTYERLRSDGTLSFNNLNRITQSSGKENPGLEGQPITMLRDMLFRYALPRVLGVRADLELKEGESTADFLQRARATALATTNWRLYYNTLAYASKQRDDILALSGIGAFRHFIAALNLESAGQRSEAVRSYTSALGAGAQNIPLDYIHGRLDAIRKNFPDDYANGLKDRPAQKVARPFPRQRQMQPPPVPNKIAPTAADVHYAGRHERQVLDFYQAKSDKPTPLMFFIHAGGWASMDKNNPAELQACLDAGISVVSINYRFLGDALENGIQPPVQASMEDAARALQFVRSKATEWNVDKERIGGVGRSTGACTALWLAFHPDMADPTSKDPVSHESTHLWCVATFVPMISLDPQQLKEWATHIVYGGSVFGFSNSGDYLAHRDQILPWIQEYSPYALATKNAPPIYLSYVEAPALGKPQKDPDEAAEFGVKLQEHCKELGVECELVYPDAPDVKHKTIGDYLVDKLKAPSAKSGS